MNYMSEFEFGCILDNCPHHAAQTGPLEKVGAVCQLKECVWDQESIADYFDAVRGGTPHADKLKLKEKKDG